MQRHRAWEHANCHGAGSHPAERSSTKGRGHQTGQQTQVERIPSAQSQRSYFQSVLESQVFGCWTQNETLKGEIFILKRGRRPRLHGRRIAWVKSDERLGFGIRRWSRKYPSFANKRTKISISRARIRTGRQHLNQPKRAFFGVDVLIATTFRL